MPEQRKWYVHKEGYGRHYFLRTGRKRPTKFSVAGDIVHCYEWEIESGRGKFRLANSDEIAQVEAAGGKSKVVKGSGGADDEQSRGEGAGDGRGNVTTNA